jgi:hypothetical protein
MKTRHYVLAAMLVGAMAVDSAAAKSGHKGAGQGATGAGAHPTGHPSDLGKGPSSEPLSSAIGVKGHDHDHDGRKPDGSVGLGETKGGDQPGKSSSPSTDIGTPHTGGQNGHLGSSGPPNSDGAKSDAGKSDNVRPDNVIVDHHHDKKPIAKTKTKTTPTLVHKPGTGPHPSGIAAIGGGPRTATGLPVQNDPKPDAKTTPEAGSKETTAVVTAPAPTTHPDVKPSTDVAKVIPGLSGTQINKPGSGPATLGGAAKNVASLNGTAFRPKHGR